jgi:hypothetical protein
MGKVYLYGDAVLNPLVAVDDLYPPAPRPANAVPCRGARRRARSVGERTQIRYLRAVAARPSPRDQAPALLPFYASNVDDLQISARKGDGADLRQRPTRPPGPRPPDCSHDRLPY